jgi:hypothetical protein
MTRINIKRLVLLVAVFSAFARAQVVVTDDANTSSFYAKTNFGSSIALIVCTGSNSYLKFNLANLGPGITSSNVSKATLVLYVDYVLTPGTMDVYQVSGSWSEGSITYNTAPALGTKLFSAVSVSKTGFLSLDLTSTVQAWLAGTQTNNGIALMPSSGSAISASFDSKENILTSHVADLTLVLVSAGSVGPQGPQGVQGPQGAVGPQGSTGATGPAGSNGAAGPIGPMGIVGPQGSAGTNGTNGTGFNFRNAFASSVTYATNDVVTYNGSTYMATAANGPSNSNPDVNPAWALMAQQGAAGGTGATGPQGASGLTGATGPQGILGQPGAQGPQGVQGQVGPLGPIGGAGPAGPATVVPNGIQILAGTFGTFKVPAGITRLLFETWGAGGSSSATQGGGAGGYCLAILNVNPGDVLNYRLGNPADVGNGNGGDSTISDSGGTVLVDAGGGQAGTSSFGSGAGGLASPCPGLGVQGGYGGANGQAGPPPFASHFPFADPSLQPAVGNGTSLGYIVVSW